LQHEGLFEVVVAESQAEDIDPLAESWRLGRVDPQAVMECGKRLQVDGIVLGDITQCRFHEPPSIAFKAEMISTETGDVIWTVDAVIDSQDPEVVKAVQKYFANRSAKKSSIFGWRSMLVSMDRYAEFACHCVVRSIAHGG